MKSNELKYIFSMIIFIIVIIFSGYKIATAYDKVPAYVYIHNTFVYENKYYVVYTNTINDSEHKLLRLNEDVFNTIHIKKYNTITYNVVNNYYVILYIISYALGFILFILLLIHYRRKF